MVRRTDVALLLIGPGTLGRLAFIGATALISGGCSDANAPDAPASGTIVVTAPIIGRDGSHDGYNVTLDAEPGWKKAATVFMSQAARFGVPPGSYALTLTGPLRENCQLTGPATQTVAVPLTVAPGDTFAVVFPVHCAAITGDVRLVARTTGPDPDPDGYSLLVDGSEIPSNDWFSSRFLLPDDDLLIPEVTPGDHVYEISEIAPNCTVVGSNARTVTVTVGEVSESVFEVKCTALP